MILEYLHQSLKNTGLDFMLHLHHPTLSWPGQCWTTELSEPYVVSILQYQNTLHRTP